MINGMPREPIAREKVLDAFVDLLLENGERAATLDAIAERSGVSKGGLLYHFGSRSELVDGFIGRLQEYADADIEAMNTSPDGRTEFYLRTSAKSDQVFSRLFIAASRLTGEAGNRANQAIAEVEMKWRKSLHDELQDDALATLAQLLGDGLYFNNMVDSQTGSADLEKLRPLLEQLGLFQSKNNDTDKKVGQ